MLSIKDLRSKIGRRLLIKLFKGKKKNGSLKKHCEYIMRLVVFFSVVLQIFIFTILEFRKDYQIAATLRFLNEIRLKITGDIQF